MPDVLVKESRLVLVSFGTYQRLVVDAVPPSMIFTVMVAAIESPIMLQVAFGIVQIAAPVIPEEGRRTVPFQSAPLPAAALLSTRSFESVVNVSDEHAPAILTVLVDPPTVIVLAPIDAPTETLPAAQSIAPLATKVIDATVVKVLPDKVSAKASVATVAVALGIVIVASAVIPDVGRCMVSFQLAPDSEAELLRMISFPVTFTAAAMIVPVVVMETAVRKVVFVPAP